jgi:hypothetical protein
MKSKRTGLILTSAAMTVYLLVATPYFILEGESLANAVVAAAIYFALVRVHLIFCGIAILTQWIGVFTSKPGFQRLASWLLLIGGLWMFPSLLVIIPLIIMNRIYRMPKEATESDHGRNQRRP